MKKKLLALVLAVMMAVGCFAGLGAGVEADVTPDEQQAALEDYAAPQLGEETETLPVSAVNYTNVAPFLQHSASPVKARALAKSASQPTESDELAGLIMNKTATANGDGTYNIKLEAYTTGTVSKTEKNKPTDIVLVLDQSGSMAFDIGQVEYKVYTGNNTQNNRNYEKRYNGGSANLWHKLSDVSYVPVSVTKQEKTIYNEITNGRNYDDGGWGSSYTNLWNNRNNLWALVDGEYVKVSVSRSRDGILNKYTYKLPNGVIIASGGQYNDKPNISGTDDNKLYLAGIDDTKTVYTYTYVDSTGAVQTIGTSTGANTSFTPAFYQRTTTGSGGGSRLNALKTAVTNFTNAVAEKAKGADGVLGTDDDINYRIAVVGFASQNEHGNNTELLSISGRNSGTVGVAYNNITNQNLKDVLQNMNTSAGQTMVTNAINALAAQGATRTDLGMDMAERILNANPVPADQTRNRVVIVFTDGDPTTSNGFDKTVANSAIEKSTSIKNVGATVYSVGIFSGADATSAGTEPSGSLRDKDSRIPAASNWFMQKLSSNNGTPQSPSYYLSAGDADTLNTIFQKISDQISESSIDLGAETVVKDVVTKYFNISSKVTASKYDCLSYNSETGEATWSDTGDELAEDAITIDGDTVNVTGFDFKANFVAENGRDESDPKAEGYFHGQKLVIEFTVTPKDGFAGGNNVPTNGTDSGIYNKDGELVKPFVVPEVNVPIKSELAVADKVIYEGQSESIDNLYTKVDTSSWKYDFVKVTYDVKQGENAVSGTVAPAECTGYTVTATFAPQSTGAGASGTPAEAATETETATIHVLVPTVNVTAKDVTKYYGEMYTPDGSNITGTVTWSDKQHEGVSSTKPAPYTDADLEFVFDKTPFVVPNSDTVINFTVKANGTDITDKVQGDTDYTVFFKTCTLTITKNANELYSENDSFIFNVTGTGNVAYSTQVVITGTGSVTLTGLPVGEYTVAEDTGWSWRYSSDNSSASVTLSSSNDDDSVTIANKLTDNRWLGDETYVINKCEKSVVRQIIERVLGIA